MDKDGLRIDVGGETGGTPVLYQNGNRWIGTGHNSMATDDAGQRWIVYHAIDRNNPFLNEPFGINRRPMLIDRIDWVHGWPLVRYGCGPSESVQPGPVVRGVHTKTRVKSQWRRLPAKLHPRAPRPQGLRRVHRRHPRRRLADSCAPRR